MCQACVDAAREIYPDLPEGDLGHLLMGATAFPFAGPEYIREQLIETREATDGSLNQAMGYADAEMSRVSSEQTASEGLSDE